MTFTPATEGHQQRAGAPLRAVQTVLAWLWNTQWMMFICVMMGLAFGDPSLWYGPAQ